MIVIAEQFKLNLKTLKSRMRMDDEDEHLLSELSQLVAEAESIGKPKGLYKPAYIDAKGDDYVEIEGNRFISRVMRINLEPAHRVFPYVATCGLELEQWSNTMTD